MPVLQAERSTSKVTLPKSGGTVEMYDEFLTGDYRKLMANESIDPSNPTMSIDKSFDFILKLIADWDFTDKDGNKLDIKAENLDLVPLTDLNVMAQKVQEAAKKSVVADEVKKN